MNVNQQSLGLSLEIVASRPLANQQYIYGNTSLTEQICRRNQQIETTQLSEPGRAD